jgi:c(7)-type cytochrome triheme protein
MSGAGLARVVVALALALTGVAAAELPNLPKEITLPRGANSPGPVAFRHDSHVDTAKPACLDCHSGRFSILGRAALAPKAAITHAVMEKGQSCGACHGKGAFALTECDNCHSK